MLGLTDALDVVDVDSTGINSWNEFHDELIDDVNELPTKKVRKLFHIIKDKRWENNLEKMEIKGNMPT